MADAPAPPNPARMVIAASGGAATGGGTSGVIAYFWNWIAVRDWGAPPMTVNDAVALSILLAPLFAYFLGWLPMPPVRNRRS